MPVAVVEAMKAMRIETVAEIRGDAERLERAGLPEASCDGAVAVDVLPRPLVPGRQLLRAHVPRLKDHMLAVIELPVAREDAPFIGEAFVKWRSGERRQDGEARQVDGRADGEFSGRFEHIQGIVIHAEADAAL